MAKQDQPLNTTSFSGYRWTYHDSLQEGPLRSRADLFSASVGWQSLLQYASDRRNGVSCQLLPSVGLGYNHMVRIIAFNDGVRWVARLRLPPLADSDFSGSPEEFMEKMEQSEYSTMSLVREKTGIPIPEIYAIEAQHSGVNASFMLMDCLPGNVGMDLGMKLPSEYKQNFIRQLAQLHVQLATVRLPQIGKIIARNEDGTYLQGPIPGIGGPFNTATEFYKAWAAKAKFGMTEEKLRAASGPYAEEIIPSVTSFPESVGKLANRLSVCDRGPFPLCHGDFGHNNTVVDDEYRVLGLIDWETAFAAPWEIFADFPLTLSLVPPSIDAPWNYDEQGHPTDPESLQQLADQKSYIEAVRGCENETGAKNILSNALSDWRRQQMVTAMRLYVNGKAGFYSRLIEKIEL